MTTIFRPSAQQADFYEYIENGHGNCVLEAVAGAGKTTTLINALGKIEGNVFFGAFNKKISCEIREKAEAAGLMRDGLRIGTMHGAGMGAWRRYAPLAQVRENKTRELLETKYCTHPDLEAATPFIVKLVSLGKQLLLPRDLRQPFQMEQWASTVDRFSLDEELPEGIDVERGIRAAAWTLEMSTRGMKSVIDFDDMIYGPVATGLKMFQQDWVFLDEAQDTNPARRALARMMLKRDGRLVAVGDRWQAIYGFTGADADALDLIAREFNCRRLPLTTTYRCPKSVVRHAQQWVSHIQAAETAPEGEVRTVQAKEGGKSWYEIYKPLPTSAVLCRYTKPLVETAYGMLRAGIACRMEGRDIGKGLIALCRRWKVKSIEMLEDRLETYLAREQRKAEEKKNPKRADAAKDKVDTIAIFIERARANGGKTVPDVVLEIDSLFADDVSGVVCLSTIHRSKGREWPVVHWLQVPNGRQYRHQWESDAEVACNYVATTRAQDALELVEGA